MFQFRRLGASFVEVSPPKTAMGDEIVPIVAKCMIFSVKKERNFSVKMGCPRIRITKKINKLTFGTTNYFNHITKTHKQLSIRVNGYMHYR